MQKPITVLPFITRGKLEGSYFWKRGLQESRSGLGLVEKLQVDFIEETGKGDVRFLP